MRLMQKSYENYHQEPKRDGDVKWISERHVACLFLIDVSSSMTGKPIKELNKGLAEFKKQTMNNPTFDTHTKSCIDVGIVTFGSNVQVIQNFVSIDEMQTPILEAGGNCSLAAGINAGLDLIEERKRQYNDLGTPYYRPWLFCITKGETSEAYDIAAQRLKRMEENKGVLGYCVGTVGFDKESIGQIFDKRRIFELNNLDFTDLFEFVSNSLGIICESENE